MRKKIFFGGLVILVILGVVVAYYAYSVYMKPNFRIENGSKISLYIDENSNFETLMAELNAKTHQDYANSFEVIAKYKKLGDNLKKGHYVLEDGMSNRVFLNRLLGRMQTPVQVKFNNIRLLDNLVPIVDRQLMLDSVQIASALSNEEMMEHFGFDENTYVSMFIPNTYEVYWTISAIDFVEKMSKEYEKFWGSKGRRAKAEALGMTEIEVSILASIVEGETNNSKEKPMVAGLYINRLRRGIPLQADPTVKFAVGDFGLTQILYKHLECDSPYNTYKYAGLPPGPISMPSIEGIDAVLNYAKHNYIYMCAKETLDGTHSFATTLTQHNANAAKYHRALRAWQRRQN